MSAQKILDKQTRNIVLKVSPEIAGYYKHYQLDLDAVCAKNGITLYEAKFEDSNVSGAITLENDTWSIVVNEEHSLKRRRFTIAHELGHYFAIKNGSISAIEHFEENDNVIRDHYVLNRESDLTDEIYDTERQANMIAAAILMPEEMVLALYKENKTIYEMAETFGVSESAMSFRLESLNIKTIEAID